jgi:E3 ubiquitin-protein ligase SHPRH
MEHVAMFFRANAYFQIKSDKDLTNPDSPDFERLEKLETEGYESAKRLRREILQDVRIAFASRYALLVSNTNLPK